MPAYRLAVAHARTAPAPRRHPAAGRLSSVGNPVYHHRMARARSAEFRFYAELGDFLPVGRRGGPFRHGFDGRPGVKDAIEALGVPHPEVSLILVDGASVGFGHRLAGGERVSAFPAFRTLGLPEAMALRPREPFPPRFVLDTHLGRLATYLRLLGHDTLVLHGADDHALARVSREEDRILLTRDRGLLKRGEVVHGRWVREELPRRQIVEVMRRYDLAATARPFRRCLRCNAVVEPVMKADVLPRLEPKTRRYYEEFGRCPGCDRVYWAGSHHARMRAFLDEVMQGGVEAAGGDTGTDRP